MKNKTVIVAIMAFLILLFAACNPESLTQYYKVNYIGTDGNVMVIHEVEYGKTDTPPESPTREGHEFIGWSLSEEGKNIYDFNTPVTGDITLYTVWKINSYKVTFVCGDDVSSPPSEISVDYGSSIPPQDVKRNGYALKGWSTKEDDSDPYDMNTPVKSDITLYPIWSKTCTIDYICDEDVVGVPKSITVDVNTVVKAPESPSKYGYEFKGWKTDLKSEENFSFGSITSDITLYPHFEGKEVNVAINYEDGKSLASKKYRTGDLLTPSSLGIGLDDSIFTWELIDSTTEAQYPVDKPLVYNESGYTFVAHISSSYISVEEGAISGSEALRAKEGPYTLFIPRYLNRKEVKTIKEKAFYSDGVDESTIYTFDKLILPDTLTSIGDSAFTSCKKLLELDIPSSVKSIGVFAFADCSLLRKVLLHEGIENIGRGSFCDCVNLIEINLPSSIKTISTDVFSRCYSLKSITLPKNITSIPERCFTGCSSLIKISFEGTIKVIGEEAFSNCESLASFSIPDTVTSIGVHAFQGCSNLHEVTLPSGLTLLSSGIFSSCSSLTSIIIPNSVTSIGDTAFSNCSGLKSINIPSTVSSISIGIGAFRNSGLESIVIPKNVTSIEEGAFLGCKNLTGITINGPITSIADNTFKECEKLTSITLPDSVTSIGKNAFYSCSDLTSVTLNQSIIEISDYAFAECSNLKNIEIPKSVQSLGEYTFYDCSKLTNVILNEGLLTINDRCFEGCSSLNTITIPSSVNVMDGLPFRWCQNLTEIIINKYYGKIYGTPPWGGNIYSQPKTITIKWLDHKATYNNEE